ncbi:MAG: hypothetical protein Q7R57_05575 [Dehalococcoidales bacterium]|nr:hypothetical protein [Dehalococcoidales bacterium]
MKKLRNCLLALMMGCGFPVLIWISAGFALYEKRKQAELFRDILSLINPAPPSA